MRIFRKIQISRFITQNAILMSALFAPAVGHTYTGKEGNISASFGWLLHQTNFERSHTGANAPLQGDVGLVVTGDLTDNGAAEIGLYHLNKQYFRDIGSVYIGEAIETIHITMGYRRYITPSFSATLAFASSHSMGYVTTFHNDFPVGQAIDTSARDTTEYSVDVSLHADLYTHKRFTAELTALYSFSVTGKPNEKADHYGAMIGLRYFIQEKQVIQKPADAM